uniref:Gamma-soluble NSF attachment protein n=1 Tax=Aureoumbra lagunensis TaxID=44058 RepID=A0A7S3K1X9_9STRA|mmetsp:Transcript_3147/g.4130  ORF Transcript_3147/g.4130 Transcript_3147/m.4130 type:complete len:308 (+) Transcript_3147:154-1077(+)|eukprot:CAMPEP_0197315792 /NCGR_PEP_ID=MMETSP0891-20130614/39587_1 /TAXON_ID=44058 ORGANISM="Aureoumbra lagunensis, Strain CCMP1510" /NCGR_SAMPLE_ID=MMETSP0891 /ASSEMBLY_ACC=CAM_ASM_000534 /LENGTH=307 /DNA_ID=CAMNT_0042804937 /DNA_START=103 /DNA_END=1026 /DNA_ORIENTATION=+
MKTQQRARGDEAFRKAEKLVNKPNGWAGFMWKPDFSGAAINYEEAGNNFRAAGAMDLANVALQRAGQNYSKINQHYQAAQNFQKAAILMATHENLWITAAEQWQLAGEPCLACDTLFRGAEKSMNTNLYWLTLEAAAEIASGGVEEQARKSFLYFISNNLLDQAVKAAPLLLSALNSLDNDHPNRLRAYTAIVILYLAQKNIQQADQTFLDALSNSSYGPSEQARIAENIIAAIKQNDQEALTRAISSSDLAALDFQVAQLVKSSVSCVDSFSSSMQDDVDDDAATTQLSFDKDDEEYDDDALPDIT